MTDPPGAGALPEQRSVGRVAGSQLEEAASHTSWGGRGRVRWASYIPSVYLGGGGAVSAGVGDHGAGSQTSVPVRRGTGRGCGRVAGTAWGIK